MKKISKKIVIIIFWGTCIYLSSFFKISFVFGSSKFFLSGLNFIAPLIGLPVAFLFLFKSFIFSYAVTFGLPTFIAAFSWDIMKKVDSKESILLEVLNFILRVLFPLVCMVLFVLHPIGKEAFIYSLYWLIPVFFYFLQNKSVFFMALTSTFLAHCMGSIIWLYTVEMSSGQWLALIPIVAVERLVFACGISIIYFCVNWCMSKICFETKTVSETCFSQLN